MQPIKNLIKNSFPKLPRIWNVRKRQLRNLYYSLLSPEQVFKKIYHTNSWGNSESFSGHGSELNQTEQVRLFLPSIIHDYKVQSILDIPCGDFNWMKTVFLNISYTGADIVKEIVDNNNRLYASKLIKFSKINLTSDPLPEVDLIFCRDCLVHLSFEHINEAIANIKKSGAKYLMTTSFPNKSNANHNIVTGAWRSLNFQAAPFNFPKPLASIDEKFLSNDRDGAKFMLLWKVSDLP